MKDLNKILKTFTKTVAKLKDLEKKNTTKCKELDFYYQQAESRKIQFQERSRQRI